MSSDDFASQGSHTSTLRVSTVEVRLAKCSHKTIASIKLSKNDEPLKDVPVPICKDGVHRIEFGSPPTLCPDDRISISVNCNWQSTLRKGVADILITIDLLRDIECMRRDEQGVRQYRKKQRNVEVVVACQFASHASDQLLATTTSIIRSCSNFRLLIIGNVMNNFFEDGDMLITFQSGVGKSSLIHKVFGVESVHVSEGSRGMANIDKEFISPKNSKIVVHDSLGFEAGDERNIDIVKDFVSRRKAMPQLKDRLHAIWLCLQTPYAGGRLLESGAEKFLRRRKEILGDVPLVVVLTKRDLLDMQLELDLPEDENLERFKDNHLNEHCIRPLHDVAGSDISHVMVSTLDDYAGSLSKLFQTTGQNMVENNVEEEPRIVAAIAQRVSIKDKIESSIAVGKRRYWNTLLKSAVFRGHTLGECLRVICQDVITVWNFDDPDKCLLDDDIIGALLRTDNLDDGSDAPSNVASFGALLASGVELAKTLATSGDITLAIAAPIAGFAFSLLKTMYSAYQEAKEDVKVLMVYTIDLICVMQAVFLVAQGGCVTADTVALALQAYQKPRKAVHLMVDAFDGKLGVLPGGRDHVLDKIEDWIWRYSVADDEIEGLRRRIGEALSPSGSTVLGT